MELRTRIETELHAAMKAGDDIRKRTLRMVLAGIKLAQVEKGIPPTEADILIILQKEVKSRREAIAEAEKANRLDLIKDNKDEIAVLETFLPQQLSDQELEDLVKAAVLEVNATTPTDTGKVMKAVLPRIQGRAPNDKVSQVVRNFLQPK